MDLLHRFFQLHRMLHGRRRPLSSREIESALACSQSTVKRLMRELRNYGAPIEWVRGEGYRYRDDVAFDLPPIGLSGPALSAVLLARDGIRELGAETAGLSPLNQGLANVLMREGLDDESLKCVRIKRARTRGAPDCLPVLLDAILRRRRLRVVYHGRGSGQKSERDIAPQRLTRYRDNWHVDAWCYLRTDLRSFAAERIVTARVIDGAWDEVPAEVLSVWSDSAYGIFNGPGRHDAVLRFSPERARWAQDEHWHPKQQGRVLPDGRYELSVPYANPTELVMDILRLGDQVEVVSPTALREQVAAALERALLQYRGAF